MRIGFTKTESRRPFRRSDRGTLAGAGATDAHAATLSDTVGSTPSETTLVQPVDHRGDGYGSMQEWNASMEAKRDSLEMRALRSS